ncbi:MAG: hypothetical protein O7D30_03680, partial [Rickettsia endosymbiont of Ixodes persulcatus]|nr:hypothetical protein [Rickettsia endosymbiont of Ixodes persulcatus]
HLRHLCLVWLGFILRATAGGMRSIKEMKLRSNDTSSTLRCQRNAPHLVSDVTSRFSVAVYLLGPPMSALTIGRAPLLSLPPPSPPPPVPLWAEYVTDKSCAFFGLADTVTGHVTMQFSRQCVFLLLTVKKKKYNALKKMF